MDEIISSLKTSILMSYICILAAFAMAAIFFALSLHFGKTGQGKLSAVFVVLLVFDIYQAWPMVAAIGSDRRELQALLKEASTLQR